MLYLNDILFASVCGLATAHVQCMQTLKWCYMYTHISGYVGLKGTCACYLVALLILLHNYALLSCSHIISKNQPYKIIMV